MNKTFTLTEENREQVVRETTEHINGYIVRRYIRIKNLKASRVLTVENSNSGFGAVNIYVQSKMDDKYHETGEFEFTINNGAWNINSKEAEEQLVKYCGAVLCVRQLERTDWDKVPVVYIKDED